MIYIDGTPYDTNKPTVLFENLFADGALTGTAGVSAGFGPENAITGSTADFWYPDTGVTYPIIRVDLASSSPANCLVIAAHNFADEGAKFQLEYSQDGGTTWADATSWITPSDNSTIMVLFDEVSGNAWRLGQANGHVKIGVL
ncbi:MAG: discoidin domain-containing protein, partial [Herbaspirillum sp.]|uniref:discoidin domain-containing protein n=1 Tax=Herbaspirillum sp. TaxID=1890675 RepID=UPI00258C2B02